jgi:hypothetical protein
MHRTLPLFFAVVTLAVCAGKTYNFTLQNPTVAGATELKPGAHTLQLVDGNAFVVDGKAETRTPVKVETVNEKYSQTSVRIDSEGGKARILEVRLGGSKTRLVVAAPGTVAGSGSNGGSGASN